MARMLTEEEVEKLEKQRELQGRAQAATDPNALYNQRMAAAHAAAMERRRGYIELNPNAETDTKLRHQVLRENELAAAHQRGMEVHKGEWDTRIREAEEKRRGMEGQGVEAAKLRYGETDYKGNYTPGGEFRLAEQQNADKEKQRQHELAMLGQTQTFQGAQNTAERQNRLDIAKTQGSSAVDAARAQAEARAADIASKERIAQGNIDAKNHATDTKAATAAAGQLTGFVKALATLTNPLTGKLLYPMEELQKKSEAEISALIEKHGLRGQ